MKRKLTIVLSFIVLLVGSLAAQLTLRVTETPDNTPPGGDIYVAGNFNDWQPGDEAYQLEYRGEDTYEITIGPPPGLLQFKFTRGNWETVEGNAGGGYLPDRMYQYAGGPATLELQIQSWEGADNSSTAAANVRVLEEAFYMPQLNRSRRVWIYLPPDYESSGKYYPVLYMQDGQNVFDAATSFSGEWQVDESLNRLFEQGDEGIIVVAIDNGGIYRTNEYSPWPSDNPAYGGGDGTAYTDFIAETLKPDIDGRFRTRAERESTGIMGSSMGGLISLYAAIEHQDIFGKAGVFSASFWFSSQSYLHVANTQKQENMKIYLIAGAQEDSDGQQVEDMVAMYNTLLGAGFSEQEVKMISHADGAHSEWYWAREYPEAYLWLFANTNTTGTRELLPGERFRLFPNPSGKQLQIQADMTREELSYQIMNPDGRTVQADTPLQGNSISLQGLRPGMYIIAFYQEGQLLFVERVAGGTRIKGELFHLFPDGVVRNLFGANPQKKLKQLCISYEQ